MDLRLYVSDLYNLHMISLDHSVEDPQTLDHLVREGLAFLDA